MRIKTKSIASMAMPLLLLLSLISCDDDRTFREKFRFIKSTKKKVAVVGEAVDLTLSLTNRSCYHVEFFELKKELNQRDFAVIGDNVYKGHDLSEVNSHHTINYKVIPLSPGKKKIIGPSKITRIKIRSYEKIYPVGRHEGFSNSVTISVEPIELSISPAFPKTEVLLGDKIHFDVLFENRSPVEVQGIELFFDGNPDDIKYLGTKVNLKQFSIPAGKSKKIPFVYRAQEVKKAELGSCFIKKFKASGHWIPLDKTYCSKPVPKLTVMPVDLKVSQHFNKKKVKLGKEFFIDLLVGNRSSVEIRDVAVVFDGDLSNPAKIRLKRQTKFLSIPCGQTRKITFVGKAMQAGTVLPGKAIIKSIQVGDSWHHLEKGYALSLPGPEIAIAPVRLPGLRNPLTYVTKEFEEYFDYFIIKTLGIILAILLLEFLFKLVIRSFLSEFLAVKIVLNFLMATVVGIILVFFFTGCLWFFQTILPSVWEIAALFAGSCCLAFAFAQLPTKNLLLGSVISGTVFTAAAYILFTGFKAYEIQEFSNYPIALTLSLVFAFGLCLNVWIFRKI